MRRISSPHHSAHRITSAACSGSALMLGMASSAFSSSRYFSRFMLMKSMTLSIYTLVRLKPDATYEYHDGLAAHGLLDQRPAAVVLDRAAFRLQLLQMRADVLVRRGEEHRLESI